MLESLKKKTLLGNLWCIIVLGIVTAALGVVFGPGIVKMLAGPAYFEPLDDHEDILSLQGQYITMDVDTLIDYYAETVSSESGKRDEVSAREYIMPINTPDATIYIGLEVPASKIDDAEAVVDDTARMLDDEDGSYEWDGSYVTVRGTLKRMDDETKQLWEDYFIDAGFSYDDIGLEDGCTFLPLVLTDDEIDGSDTFVLGFMGIVMLLVLALLIWFVVRSLTGGFQKQIRRYIAATADPEGTEQALDRFYEDTMQDGKVRTAACIGGMLAVADGKVRLVPTTFEWAEDIDLTRARHAKEYAEAYLDSHPGETDSREYRHFAAKYKRALIRIAAAQH